MKRLNLKVKKLSNFVDLRQRDWGNAGFDLYSTEEGLILPSQRKMISVGISTSFEPDYYMRIAPRSGLASKSGVDVLAGVIDSSYRGEWKVILYNTSNTPYVFKVGDRIAQAIPERISNDHFEFVDSLEESERSDKGFGSSGA
jgi:dUTP pyrophosphatase